MHCGIDPMERLRLVVCLFVLFLLGGCGQKGELYLPTGETSASQGSATNQPDRDDSVQEPVNVDRPPL